MQSIHEGIYGLVRRHDVVDADGAFALERRVVALSEEYLENGTYGQFAEAQVAVTGEWLPNSAPTPGGTKARVAPDAISAAQRRVLGGSDESPISGRSAFVETLVAFTPAFRARLLFPPEPDRTGAPLEATRVPYALLALETLASLALDAGMRVVTYQTLSRLFAHYQPLLKLLSYSDCVMELRPDLAIDLRQTMSGDHHRRYLRVARALLPSNQNRQNRTLEEVLLEQVVEGVGRLEWLRHVAERLVDRVQIRGASTTSAWRRGRVRVGIQKMLLAEIGDEQLTRLLGRPRATVAAQ